MLATFGGISCADDRMTNPHVSMSRGTKFWSSTHMSNYFTAANTEVARWQKAYPYGVHIGSSGTADFGQGNGEESVGYGNLYFFYNRNLITRKFSPNRDLTDTEKSYATIDISAVTLDGSETIPNSDKNDDNNYFSYDCFYFGAYNFKKDPTVGANMPCGCYEEGEAFFGIPLAQKAAGPGYYSNGETESYQSAFDFSYLVDRSHEYVKKFETNHGWITGEAQNER